MLNIEINDSKVSARKLVFASHLLFFKMDLTEFVC